MKKLLSVLLALLLLCSTCVFVVSADEEPFDKELAFDVDAYVIAMRSGTLGEVNIQADPNLLYRGLFMTQAMIPNVLCETDGIYCPQSTQFTDEHAKVDFLENGDLIEEVTFDITDYDNGWGPCVFINVKFSEKAKSADPQSVVKTAVYYEKDGHKTQPFYMNFYMYELPSALQGGGIRVLEEDIEGLVDMVDGYVNQMRSGVLGEINITVQPDLAYKGRFMTQGLISYVLCETDGIFCPELTKFSAEHMKVEYLTNENFVENLSFELTDNGDGWGPCVFMSVSFTDAAFEAAPNTAVNTSIYFEKDGHKTQPFYVNFYMYEHEEAPQGGINIVEDPDDLYATEPETPTGITGTVNVKQGSASISAGKMAAFTGMSCRLEGEPCDVLKGCTAADLNVEFESGEELAQITFTEDEDGNILMNVELTAAGKKADLTEKITGKVYASKEADYLTHISDGISFEISLESQGSSVDPIVIILIVVVAVLVVAVAVAVVLLLKKKK